MLSITNRPWLQRPIAEFDVRISLNMTILEDSFSTCMASDPTKIEAMYLEL